MLKRDSKPEEKRLDDRKVNKDKDEDRSERGDLPSEKELEVLRKVLYGAARVRFAVKHRLCIGCLQKGHAVTDCENPHASIKVKKSRPAENDQQVKAVTESNSEKGEMEKEQQALPMAVDLIRWEDAVKDSNVVSQPEAKVVNAFKMEKESASVSSCNGNVFENCATYCCFPSSLSIFV